MYLRLYVPENLIHSPSSAQEDESSDDTLVISKQFQQNKEEQNVYV
jgi:hypothetical protein